MEASHLVRMQRSEIFPCFPFLRCKLEDRHIAGSICWFLFQAEKKREDLRANILISFLSTYYELCLTRSVADTHNTSSCLLCAFSSVIFLSLNYWCLGVASSCSGGRRTGTLGSRISDVSHPILSRTPSVRTSKMSPEFVRWIPAGKIIVTWEPTRLYDEKVIKEVSSDKRYLKSQWDMNVGMHCSINQLGLLQEVAEIGEPSVDPSSHICCMDSVATSSRHDPLLASSAWALLAPTCSWWCTCLLLSSGSSL